MKKILVAHPLQQHSYKTAIAFAKEGCLHGYDTTIYYNEKKMMYRVLARVLSQDSIQRMMNRKEDVLAGRVQTHLSFMGLLYLLIYRRDVKRQWEPVLYSILTGWFGRIIAKKVMLEDIDILWMYDTTAERAFSGLKNSRKVIKVLDMSSAAAPYIRKIIVEEMDKYPQYVTSLKSKLNSYSEVLCEKYLREINNADYFIVPSGFVAQSLELCGVSKNRIRIVPYGVNVNMFTYKEHCVKRDEKVRLLFVGRIEAAKGVHYLAEVMQRVIDCGVELTLVGSMQSGMNHVFDGISNVHYAGMKRRDEMPKVYHEYDVLVLPSMWEGFSQTVTEAMASGMPVLVSDHTGADSLVINYENGIIFPSGDIAAIEQGIRWYVTNRDKIEGMGKLAAETVKKYTWERYEEKLCQIVEAGL